MFISHYNGHGIKLVRALSNVDNTRDYARVSHSRQWSNYNMELHLTEYSTTEKNPQQTPKTR